MNFSGVVEETGSAVSGLKLGDLVVAPFVWADMFLRNITVTGGVAPARAYIEELLPDILEGRIEPGRVFDRTATWPCSRRSSTAATPPPGSNRSPTSSTGPPTRPSPTDLRHLPGGLHTRYALRRRRRAGSAAEAEAMQSG